MSKKVPDQSQTSGDNSQNISVGRDLIYQKMSYAEIKGIALSVYLENILQLSRDAEDLSPILL